ncbi:MAG: hypothetical protein Q4G67_07480 [Actinomycetia bacterium]|nr:hypothetical protein [Actinomycetes bacterium]
MPNLPASVRVALWATHAWSLGADTESIVARALPDVDVVLGLTESLELWRDLGERAVFAALPRPGSPGQLPRVDPAVFDAAATAGEALFVAGVGGLLVPRLVIFGADSPGEAAPATTGLAARWEAFDADPVPLHRIAGVDVAGADRALRTEVHAAIDALGDGGWADAWQGETSTASVPANEHRWALPSDLPDRVRGLLMRAGSILEITDAGLAHAQGSSSVGLGEHRTRTLRALNETATAALEAATGAGVSYLSAQSRRTRS